MDGIDTRQLVLDPQTANEYKGKVDPDWCAGCGDFGVLNSLRKACLEMGLKPHEMLTVSGIGCSSNFPGTSIPMACIRCTDAPLRWRPVQRWPIMN